MNNEWLYIPQFLEAAHSRIADVEQLRLKLRWIVQMRRGAAVGIVYCMGIRTAQ
jgi:hypothetical protein